MNPLAIFRTKQHRFTGCTPPSAADRMARYSQRHADDMRQRENAGAAAPKVRLVDGRPVLIALEGRVNVLPEPHHAIPHRVPAESGATPDEA
jgi:hypothetical protein